jgi:cell division protease FtsH
LGRSMSRPANGQSDETARLIDQEVKEILDTCYATAKQTLEDNMDKLHLMADALMEYETIDAKQIDQIMKGKKPGPPDGWSDNDKPHGGTPEVHDDLQEASADGASDPTPKDGTAPTN